MRIKQKIENTSGLWKPFDASKEIELAFRIKGSRTIRVEQRVESLYKRAIRQFERDNFETALFIASKAIALNASLVNLYILRSECNLRLNRIDKYCEDLTKAKNLNPLVSLSNTEFMGGEMILIECITN